MSTSTWEAHARRHVGHNRQPCWTCTDDRAPTDESKMRCTRQDYLTSARITNYEISACDETLPGRLELPTLRLTASRSNKLRHERTHTCDQTLNIASGNHKNKMQRNNRTTATQHIETIGGPVAQWIRHRPTEPGIAGSSPAGVMSVRGMEPVAPAVPKHACETKSTASAIV